jgi:hypothetical protein
MRERQQKRNISVGEKKEYLEREKDESGRLEGQKKAEKKNKGEKGKGKY